MKPGLNFIRRNAARAVSLLTTAMALAAVTVRAAGPFTVNSAADTHVFNTNAGTDGSGNVTLRSAIEAANAGGGATINVPAGTYNLTLGELDVSPGGGQATVIQTTGGATSANTFIIQTDTNNRVFNIDSSSSGGTVTVLSGFTIQGGHDRTDNLGGAGILAGSVTNANKDSLTLAGCVIQSNRCVEVTAGYTANPGGGVQMAGGDLTVNNCTFSSNSSASAFGGAIFFFNQAVPASLNVTNSTFANNSMTNDSGSGPDGGGAIMIGSVAGSTHNFSGDTFIGNKAIGTFGNALGGAIQMNGGALNITLSTFISNSVTGATGQGGALYADSGSFNVSFCRFVGNSATAGGNSILNHATNGATTVADNNWWSSDTGPGTNGFTGASTTTYLMLTLIANPNSIALNSSSALTASFVTNSTGTAISTANLATLIGLPITFGAVKGTITSPQSTIQPSGTATATYNSLTIPGPASASATVDNVTVVAPISLPCPAISATASGGGSMCIGGSSTVTVTVTGGVGPYTIALNNGGGTNIGASPLHIVVTPSANTTYSITSAFDADGCGITMSGSATVTVNPLPVATITPTPSSVCGNSGGNTASGPAGMSGYNWTIANGTFTGPATAQTISYVAGTSGSVTLGLTVTNATGCTSNTSINVPIIAQPVATITPSPAVVTANSPDNQASGPSGVSGYSWTITNGFITSGTNAQVMTYIAGNQGDVELGLTVTNATGCTSNSTLLVPIILAPAPPPGWSFRTNYFASFTFTNGLVSTTMPIAFDGTNYWSCSGGSSTGVRLAQYDTNGNLLATYSPGLDFRSVFTDASGNLLARQYNDPTIYIQTSPGVFAPSGVVLKGGSLNGQSSVVLDGSGSYYAAISSGVVTTWDADGNLLGTVSLKGFGSVSGETNNYQNRGVAAFGNFWLTYNGGGVVSVWDTFGNRLATCVLTAAGTTTESGYSFGYCNGKVFIVDSASGFWRGYNLGSPGQVAIYGAPSTASWNTDVQSKILGPGTLVKADAYLVSGTNPVPTLTNLVQYEGALVYSDAGGFSSSVNLGNALASYISGGGGVVVATFGLQNSGLGIQGALLTNGDMPIAEGPQTASPGLTLVEDVPGHQIFNGVTSFNGGSASYHDLVTLSNSATLVGHWSDNTPLVAVKDIAPGRIVALNFYPPSSDARSDFWVSTTSGGALMANSLLWAGKVPPVITSSPTNLILSPHAPASFSVTATGLPPLTYQWRKNGNIIPGATTNILSFTDQYASNGFYTVLVSNSYGVAVSEFSTLNSPVQFLPVSVAPGGVLPLTLGASDGSPLTPYRASRIFIYAATNSSAPFASWAQLGNPLVLSNGVVVVEGLTVTNSRMFFRASEAP